MLIVVDKFAALAKEMPEFVDKVVDIAARGRSLGIHLIMATQRPSGVIGDNIKANTNLEIALRIADFQDSHDILGVDSAAHISKTIPGRGFVKVGTRTPKEFQSAYIGYNLTDEES
ncbi:MAG: hypothetical protein LBP35_00875 [Candidatus Ancillula trichonymphae]|nr:hypothetical protein [Candidatus Ancillula trichonymphae]